MHYNVHMYLICQEDLVTFGLPVLFDDVNVLAMVSLQLGPQHQNQIMANLIIMMRLLEAFVMRLIGSFMSQPILAASCLMVV